MEWQSQREDLARKITDFPPSSFDGLALEVFRYQARHNPVYGEYISLLGVQPDQVRRLEDIPFLPIQLFKSHAIQTGDWRAELQFSSSGTTGAQTSRHAVRDAGWYRANAERCFAAFYGPPEQYCFLALLPSYLEREGSSLVYMAEHFIRRSPYPQSGFFLNDWNKLNRVLAECREKKIPTALIGVSFALLDLAEQYPQPLSEMIVMETGGMKGRRRELTRDELHAQLESAFSLASIHSEYGMTELLSQAYSPGGGRFLPGPPMRVYAREIADPLALQAPGRLGALNIIDLANIDSCAFIATEDLGRVHPGGAFEVLGRMDHSDARGCNLLALN